MGNFHPAGYAICDQKICWNYPQKWKQVRHPFFVKKNDAGFIYGA